MAWLSTHASPDEFERVRRTQLTLRMETAWGRGDWIQAETLIRLMLDSKVNDPGLPRRLLEAQARAGHLDAARMTLMGLIQSPGDTFADRMNLARLQLATGDWDGYERNSRYVAERISPFLMPLATLNNVSWCFALGPNPSARLQPWTRRFAALRPSIAQGSQDELYLNTYAGLLIRGGRHAEAKAILDAGAASFPQDWAFLAIANQALGQNAEARRWMARFDAPLPADLVPDFWVAIEVEMLRQQAVAAVFYDPIFPANPFASPPTP